MKYNLKKVGIFDQKIIEVANVKRDKNCTKIAGFTVCVKKIW